MCTAQLDSMRCRCGESRFRQRVVLGTDLGAGEVLGSFRRSIWGAACL